MWRDLITTVLELLAASLLIASAVLIYVPAGLAVAGLILGLASWRLSPPIRSEASRDDSISPESY